MTYEIFVWVASFFAISFFAVAYHHTNISDATRATLLAAALLTISAPHVLPKTYDTNREVRVACIVLNSAKRAPDLDAVCAQLITGGIHLVPVIDPAVAEQTLRDWVKNHG